MVPKGGLEPIFPRSLSQSREGTLPIWGLSRPPVAPAFGRLSPLALTCVALWLGSLPAPPDPFDLSLRDTRVRALRFKGSEPSVGSPPSLGQKQSFEARR